MENAKSITVDIPNGNSSHKVTFHETKSIGNPLLKDLEADLLEKVNQAHIKIIPYEKAINKWVGASDKNAQLYAVNPIEAIESANIGIPQDIINELKKASQLVLTTLKK